MKALRSSLVSAALAVSLAACGGSSSSGTDSLLDDPTAGDDNSTNASGPSESPVSAPQDISSPPPTASAASDGGEAPAVGTVTLGDGTTYDMQIYQCGTNESGDYDLNGFATDVEVGNEPVEKIEVNFGRTGDSFVSGRFEGKYPDGRQFAYSAKEPAALAVDDQTVSGSVALDGLGGPLGDTLDLTIDVTCGLLADPPPFL